MRAPRDDRIYLLSVVMEDSAPLDSYRSFLVDLSSQAFCDFIFLYKLQHIPVVIFTIDVHVLILKRYTIE